ncbi:recombinase family protein [Streptomyces iranensis]|uniref:DNA invertase Pin-like site-specific DNA recombinase n=2 Tax=Streptomyces iranensis TaxID=576784 RepID=A0ABS4MJ65_9ACTN|nr:recombinase family protein [Streptomyces iranensis]MBP2059744.1 DNA invertase Pin-like site-specific DNA recombinase [Streptomyces iranensis]
MTVLQGATQLEALSAIRLSVRTDETTSPGRQRAANGGSAQALGAKIIGEAEDLDVSASKTTPFERPELSKWLAEPSRFDMILWWRLDRAVRSMADMHELAKWARTYRKMLVFAEGPGGMLKLDFRNPLDPIAEIMVTLLAFAAQMEAQAIRERVQGASAAMRAMALRWRGARPPYGYMPAPMPDGAGQTLVPDPDAVKVIERIVRELIEGGNPTAIARSLNSDDPPIPTPRDHWALKQGRATGGRTGGPAYERGTKVERFKWGASTINSLLRSPALLGHKLHGGVPVRDASGRPVAATAEPILTREEFDNIAELLGTRARDTRPAVRKDTNALLLRVIFCAGCDGRMYYTKASGKRKTNVYGCRSAAHGVTCETPASIKAEWVEEYVKREFLQHAGRWEVIEIRKIPGYDPGPEIGEVSAELEAHMKQSGRFRSEAGRRLWEEKATALETRLEELEATPRRPPVEEEIRTGRTYADQWESEDDAGKRNMLLDAGARVLVKQSRAGGKHALDESRLAFDVAQHSDPEAEALEEARHQALL